MIHFTVISINRFLLTLNNLINLKLNKFKYNQKIDYYTHSLSGDIRHAEDGVQGLDFWNQTKDYLEPITDQDGIHSAVSNPM